MPRLISEDEAKEILRHLLYETAMNNLDIADIYADIAENRLCTWFALIPTADSVKHGHWEYNKNTYTLTCSVCGAEINKLDLDWALNAEANYCPICGADMRVVAMRNEVDDAKTD